MGKIALGMSRKPIPNRYAGARQEVHELTLRSDAAHEQGPSQAPPHTLGREEVA
ncbi:MAG: hypothetical protein ACRDTH_17440 [Pseudonocardiaceae bacterium]